MTTGKTKTIAQKKIFFLKTNWATREAHDQTRQHIKKQRRYFVNKGLSSQSYGFSI